MDPIDAVLHALNLFAAAAGVGALSAGAVKLLWRRELAGVPWLRLVAWSAGAAAVATLAGLVVGGRDGRMGTYAAMVAASAAALGWAAFGPGRR
jgi:hypothetical protein